MTSVSGPTAAAPRSQITVDATVKIAGQNGAGGFYVGIYLSADQSVNTLDTFLGQVYVSSLGTGGEQPVTLTVTLPNSRGTYYIGAIADKLNMVAESNETNNGLAGNQIVISR
jgi:subtilase family serine protease